MPILELKAFEKIPRKKPFKFLSGVFKRQASNELEITEDMLYGTDRSVTPAGHLDIEEEMENLHLSRRDNPYLSSCEALDDCCGEEASLSPTVPGSPPDSSEAAVSPPTYKSIVELHSHLVRSPPPVHWPVKAEEGGDCEDGRALSPESGVGSDTERRSQSVEGSLVDPFSPLSPVRGQTPAVSPARVSSPSQEPPVVPVSSQYRAYSRSISQSSTRLRSKTPDEEFSPTRFNIYAVHQRSSTGLSRSCKSKSSYLVTSPGRDCVYNYQPASRRSLAQLASGPRYGNTNNRKSSMDTFTSWLPRRKRTRSQTRPDAKSMENLQSPSQCYGSVRTIRDKPSYSHKSLSCTGEDAGLISQENEALVNSPSHNRKSLHSIKKSFSLKQKKSLTGPLYIDIDSQGNI